MGLDSYDCLRNREGGRPLRMPGIGACDQSSLQIAIGAKHLVDNAGSKASRRNPQLKTYQGCGAGHPVRWCSFDGDHIPSPIDRGQNTTWVPQEVWTFFSQF